MASAFEHKTLTWLRSRFEQGDIPTGADFARLIDSCHNSLAHTDSIITGSLTVSGDITCMGSVNGTQSIVTNDPRVESLIASVDTLSTFITTNSASWNNTVTIDDITLDESLEYLYSKFQDGDTPTQEDFQLLINASHNTNAHENTYLSDLLTVVRTNSAAWFSGDGGGGPDITDLTSTVRTNSAYWSSHTDITGLTIDLDGLTSTVRTNSAAWLSDGPGPDITDLTSTVSANSAYWSSHTDITGLTIDLDGLTSTVSANSAYWSSHTDITGLTGDVNNLTSTVRTNSANWETGGNLDLTQITSTVSANSAYWSSHTDVTGLTIDLDGLTSTVSANSAAWLSDGPGPDITDLTSTVRTNSAYWSSHTDITSLTADVSSLTTYVQDNTGNWLATTDVTTLTADLDNLTSTVSTNSGDWSSHTDVTSLTASLDSLRSHVAAFSGTWYSSSSGVPGTGGIGGMAVIRNHVDHFYTDLPDEIISYDASTSQEVVLRLFIVDCSGATNFLYRNVHTDSTNPYFIWFDDTVDGDYTSTDNSGNLLTQNLRWYIENDRARYNGSTSSTIEHSVSSNWQSAFTTVSSNSASWSETTSTTSSGGSVGAFITQLTCGDNNNVDNGIVEPLYDIDEVPVDSKRPLVSALVDTSDVRFFLQWEGPADEWTGTPTVSGHEVPRADTIAIGGNHARRFEGYIDLDLAAYTGSTITIDYNYQGLDKSIDLEIAGGGPEIVNFEFTSTPGHGQDHYKDGDTIEFVVMFNTTDVVSYSLQGANDTASKTYTNESVTMNGVSATITAECDTTVTSITDLPVRIKARNTLGTETPDWYESVPTVPVLNGPVITNVTFGAYPGTQTELKDGDTVPVTFEFDTNNVNRVETSGNGNNSYASSNQTLNVTTASFSGAGTMTVDTSLENNTGGFERPIRAKARHSSQQFGNQHDSVEKLTVNNQKPTFSAASIIYPSNQEAIKATETATVNIVVSNEGDTAQATYTYTGNGRNELSIPDTTTYSANKVVTYANGTYNINSANYKLEVTRQENDNTASKTATVFIADALPTIDITTNGGTDMRSGGEDGTTMQNYNVVMNSDQRLIEQPSIAAPVGTLASGFSYSANSTQFTTTIGIHDSNARGTHTYTALSTKNLAGQTQNTINSGSDYTIRGFVLRTLTVASQGWQVQANVAAVNYNKVEIDWEKKALTTQASLGDTTRPQSNTWSLDRLSAPITVNILDSGATIASSNATSLTIEEKL